MIQYYAMPGLKIRLPIAMKGENINDTIARMVDSVIGLVAENNGIKKQDVYLKSRKRPIVEVRYMCMYLMFNKLGLNKSQIGRILRLDHTTVLHGIKTCTDLSGNDANFRMRLFRVSDII